MNPRNPKLLLALAIVSLTSVAALGGPLASTPDGNDTEPRYAWMSPLQLEEFDRFPLYWLGREFDGLDLYAIVLEREPVEGTAWGRDSVDFLYGDCDASDGGRPFPASIQIWPSCRRNLSMYEYGGRPMEYEPRHIRGVPAASFESFDGRLELYTGVVTVVIFGDTPERVEKAADALHAVGALAASGGPGPGDALPAPVDGALEGRVSCDMP